MKRFLILIASVLIVACDGSFTKEITIDTSDFVSKGVMVALWANSDSRDSLFPSARYYYYGNGGKDSISNKRLFVSDSKPVGQEVYGDFFEGQVDLQSVEGVTTLPFLGENSEWYDEPFHYYDQDLVAGREYEVMVQSIPAVGRPSWSEISAKDTMPSPVAFAVEDVKVNFPGGDFSGFGGSVRLVIQDEKDRDNTYRIEVVAIVTDTTGNSLISRSNVEINGASNEGLFEYNVDENKFEDTQLSSEGKIRIDFNFNSYTGHTNVEGTEVHMFYRLSNLSDNYLKYTRSADQYYNNEDNPFTEPVEIFSNVKNGYGIFGLYYNTFQEYTVIR